MIQSSNHNHIDPPSSANPLKILCLVNWQMRAGNRWFWDHLPGNRDQVNFVTIKTPPDRFPGYGKLLGYYQRFFLLALKAFPQVKNHDVVVAWEGNNGIPLAFLRTLTGQKRKPFVILNFVLKGQVVLSNLWFIRYALKSVDKIVCVSNQEVEYYSKVLKIPRTKFVRIPTMWPDHHANAPIGSGDYILASGRSHRDYKTLIEAVRGLPVKLVINARPFNLKGLLPPENVTFNPLLPINEYYPLLRNAKFTILPMYEAKHASGETVLLESMAACKAVIATETFTMVEFIQPGVNGYLVKPGDVQGLREKIITMLESPDETIQMGLTARKMYEENWALPVIAQKVDQLLHQVVEESKG